MKSKISLFKIGVISFFSILFFGLAVDSTRQDEATLLFTPIVLFIFLSLLYFYLRAYNKYSIAEVVKWYAVIIISSFIGYTALIMKVIGDSFQSGF